MRKAANDLRKCEEKIASAEEEIASIDEQMALPENYSNAGKLAELNSRKEALEEELSGLYEKWEELSENV
jgi:ATP-binding cassette subfamily F protein 3